MKNCCRKHHPFMIVLLVSFTLACSLIRTTSPAPAETQASPTVRLTPTTTLDFEESTRSPSDPTPTPPPAAALHPSGPWLILRTTDSLYAVNPDGTGPVLLADTASWVSVMNPAGMISPAGGHIAFLTADNPVILTNLVLNIMTLPDQQTSPLAYLIAPQYAPDPSAEYGDPALMAARTLTDVPSFAWSPDGTKLAFMAVLEGETADLYVHDFASSSTTRLTDGPSHGIRPSWSPDGRWIVHTGVSSLGTGAGFAMEGIWAAEADGTSVRSLYPIPENSGDEVIHGWLSEDEFVVSTWNAIYGDQALRTYNIQTGETRMIIENPFTTLALDPGTGTVLYYVDRYTAQDPADSGFFKFHIDTGTTTVLTEEPTRFAWDSASGSYLIITESRTFSMTPGGAETIFPSEIRTFPVFLPGSDRWAAAQGGAELPGIWASTSDGSVLKLSQEPFSGVSWTPDGGLIAYGSPGLAYAPPGLDTFIQTGTESLLVSEAVWLTGPFK